MPSIPAALSLDGRMPASPAATAAEYCQQLNQRGPALIVFFEESPLAECPLPAYTRHAQSADPEQTIKYYYLRR